MFPESCGAIKSSGREIIELPDRVGIKKNNKTSSLFQGEISDTPQEEAEYLYLDGDEPPYDDVISEAPAYDNPALMILKEM